MAIFYAAVLSDCVPMANSINYLVDNFRTTTDSHLLTNSKQVLTCIFVLLTIKR